MKTFAFKNSQKYWSTRYSFSPRNYSRLDRDMFTSHPSGSNAIYIHGPKANASKNTYYGNTTSSSIRFTFNNDPSQNKIYKNLSVEGSFNKKSFTGSFKANDSTDPGQSRPSRLRGWKEKGAHLHATIERSPNSGRANIVPVGVVRRIHQAFFPELTDSLGAMWFDTGKTQSQWLDPNSTAEVLDLNGDGPSGLSAILPYGLDKAYLANNSLMSSDPDALKRGSSRYLFMEIDFFPGYKDSSGKAKYMLAGAEDFDPSTIYGVPYDSVDAPYYSDLGLCFSAKNKATGNFKRREYTPELGFTFDPSDPYSINFDPTQEGLFVYYKGTTGGDDDGEGDGGGEDPITETEFTCADALITIFDGTVGQPVSATASGLSIISVVPAEYVEGTAAYTVNFNVPSGYTNYGEPFSCQAQGIGNEQVDDSDDDVDDDVNGEDPVTETEFTCDIAGLDVLGSLDPSQAGQPINYTLAQGSVVGDLPLYVSGSSEYTVTIAVPKGYSNYSGGAGTIQCTSTANVAVDESSDESNADINGDGSVSVADILELLSSFGSTVDGPGNWNPDADLNNDGAVATSDLLVLLTEFGNVYARNQLRQRGVDIPAYVSALNTVIANFGPIIVYAITPENVNGEAARGNYADVSLTFPGVDFELDIVNLDYEPTQLDHSR